MRDVIRALIRTLEEDRAVVFCQIVETRGSTPQKAGAAMLVLPDGGQVGTLGGGCVENEVRRDALRRLHEPGPSVHSFLLDHDDAWADGLVCGGRMTVVVEALRGEAPLAYFRALAATMDRGGGFTEAVVVSPESPELGRRALFDADGRREAGGASLEARPAPLSERPRPRVERGVAWLPSPPTVRLVIAGAGHVGREVAALAGRVDFDVWVIDDRRRLADAERFPDAGRILVGPIAETLASIGIDANTYILIVTRGHGHDRDALGVAAPTAASYVGLIGSRRKIRMIFEALRERGVSEEALARVSAPVGLDIGSRTVPEIAVSVVAQLIARRNLGAGREPS